MPAGKPRQLIPLGDREPVLRAGQNLPQTTGETLQQADALRRPGWLLTGGLGPPSANQEEAFRDPTCRPRALGGSSGHGGEY